MIDHHRNLISAAARFYERYRTNRPKPFNVFSVLRSTSDEVNLHSRFLHALLEYVDPLTNRRENLKEFVSNVLDLKSFEIGHTSVWREWNNIDLLISNRREAVVIENKIWAGDQPQQLQKYRNTLIDQGYAAQSIHLVYLTPYGHEPSVQSTVEIPVEQVQLVSYREDLRDWLIGCQRRAYDDPGLRESIAQYIRLILSMTNNDYEAEHMDELKKLLLLDDNVIIASHISNSLLDAEVELVRELYHVIDNRIRSVIEDLPGIDRDWVHLMQEDEIRKCIRGRSRVRDSGLNYQFAKNAWLCIGGNNRLWCGVACSSYNDADLHTELKEALSGVGGTHHSSKWAPWFRWMDELSGWKGGDEWLHICEPNEQTLRFLSSEHAALEEFSLGLAHVIDDLWKVIKQRKLATLV